MKWTNALCSSLYNCVPFVFSLVVKADSAFFPIPKSHVRTQALDSCLCHTRTHGCEAAKDHKAAPPPLFKQWEVSSSVYHEAITPHAMCMQLFNRSLEDSSNKTHSTCGCRFVISWNCEN